MAEREYVGSNHVHTRFSDGHTPAETILRIAGEAGLDFLVITDHNRDTCRAAGLTGWRGDLLSISAPEIGGFGQPHFISFALRDIDALTGLSSADALAAAHGQGATNIIAHPHPAHIRFYRTPPVGWGDIGCTAFDGLEIWSYMHDVCHELIPWRLHRLWRAHESLVTGPRPETLSLWDTLCRSRRVAAVCGLDNHARYVPLLGETLPHEALFRLLRMHVICPELPADGAQAEASLATAMAEGMGFVAMDGWGDATGFRLAASEPGGGCLGFGQEAAYGPGWTLTVTSPLAADLSLLRDGRPVATRTKADRLEFAVDAPGVYRAEARLDGRPWVFTNPIYLRSRGPAEPEAGQE